MKNNISRTKHCFFRIFLIVTFFLIYAVQYTFSETITFSAKSMSGTVSDNVDYTRLAGDAFVKTDSMELEADEIELKGQDYRYIVANGNISGTYSEAGFTFSCDAITYDREDKIAILEGNVAMVDTENDVDLNAAFVEYNQNTEVALIQIDVEIIQGKSVCTSAFALYRKDIQILELSGSPKITQEEDIFQAHEIVFNLDTEEITLIGNVQGTVTDTSDDEDDTDTESTNEERNSSSETASDDSDTTLGSSENERTEEDDISE